MKFIKIILLAIILFILVIFAHYNQESTRLVFLSYGGVTYQSLEFPLFAFFYVTILLTIIVMSFVEIAERTSLRIKNRRLQKENANLKTQLATYQQQEEAEPSAEPEQEGGLPEPPAVDEDKKVPPAKKKK
jgi:uncharacterized integral membrane protein